MTAFITLNPIDPQTDTRVTVRVCASQDPAHTGAAGQVWWPAIVVQPIIQARLFDGDFTSGVDAGSASTEISLGVLQSSGQFPRVERYDWFGATATIQRMGSGGTLLDVAVMRVESFASEDLRLALRMASSQDLLEADVLSATYAGTTGIEGGADLKGRVKPWVFGRAANVEPVFIDQIDNVFQVSGYGPVQAISAVYERGASFGASVGDFANYAALVAANIPEGRWGTCLAQGLFRLGAPPAGVVTCDVDGDNTDGFLRRTGAIISSIAARLGLSASMNAASLAALDTAVARNVNIVISEQISFLELVQRMAAPCNAVPGIDALGRLIVSRVTIGTATITLDAQGREMPPVLGMARQNTSAPYKRIQIGAARSWRVHSLDEIAFFSDLIDRGLYDAATVYREGDIVASADKSRWLYVNLTPGSGNAPPTWPTASNAFWSNLEPPLAPAAIGLEPGSTRNVARGTYDAGTAYIRGDEVLFSGSSYRLIVDASTGNAPPDALRWALLANAGSGPAGADGLEGITIVVSNESHTVATAQDGSGGDYSSAGGSIILRRGATVLTPTFSIAAQSPNTGWATINSSTGVYTITDPGVNLGTATIRATWAGVDYDRTYTIAKSRQGVTGPRLALAATEQAFTFTDGAASPGSQTITIEALLNNLSGTASWSTTPTVTLGGTGNTRTLSVANFGTNRQVTVEATLGGITDKITIVRLERNIVAAANANRVPLSRYEGGAGWAVLQSSFASNTAVFAVPDGGRTYIGIDATASAANQNIFLGNAPRFPVIAGERLSVSSIIRVSANSGPAPNLWRFDIEWFDVAGAELAGTPFTTIATSAGAAIDLYRAGFVTVPTGAASARLSLRAESAGAGSLTVRFMSPMIASAAADQTAHPPFSPGPVITGPVNAGGPLFVGQLPAPRVEYGTGDTVEDLKPAEPGSDVTATAQRSIEPQFPVIEIKQGEAGHTGSRTVTHTAKRGTATLTGGTWSLPSQNLGASPPYATINPSTGTVTLSGIVQSGAYVVRYTHTDSLQTDLPVNVTYIPTPPSGVVSAKVARDANNNGVPADNNWNTVLTLTVTGAPAGRVNFGGFNGVSFLVPTIGTGTADYEARLRLDNTTTLVSLLSQNVVSGGIISFADFSQLFIGSYAVAAGTRTFTIELRRTSGTGQLTQTNTALEATIIAS